MSNIILDNWLSEKFGFNVYKLLINEEYINSFKSSKDSIIEFNRILKMDPVFIYCKVPTNELKCVRLLENSGFLLIETNVGLQLKITTIIPNFTGMSIVRFAEKNDEIEVVNLVRRSFIYSRFHTDDRINNEIANDIKGEWARNFFKGTRGDAMVVAYVNNRIIGFLQLIFNCNCLVIDLIAVDLDFRKMGIASDMILFAQKNYKDFSQMRVNTQIINIPSLRLYQKLGFEIENSHYIYHYIRLEKI